MLCDSFEEGEVVRVAFTLAFNCLHHLTDGDYVEQLLPHFDHWVFVEGMTKPGGSTRWCKPIPDEFHDGHYHSRDGTLQWLQGFCERHKNASVHWIDTPWESKDDMVNVALDELHHVCANQLSPPQGGKISYPISLFQIDADEKWSANQIESAERDLMITPYRCGAFRCDAYVGPGLVCRGQWGEGVGFEYRRIFKWFGEKFISHEPVVMDGISGSDIIVLPQRFRHNSYLYEKDILFKSKFYDMPNLHSKWIALNKRKEFPVHISELIEGTWAGTNSFIIRE